MRLKAVQGAVGYEHIQVWNHAGNSHLVDITPFIRPNGKGDQATHKTMRWCIQNRPLPEDESVFASPGKTEFGRATVHRYHLPINS